MTDRTIHGPSDGAAVLRTIAYGMEGKTRTWGGLAGAIHLAKFYIRKGELSESLYDEAFAIRRSILRRERGPDN